MKIDIVGFLTCWRDFFFKSPGARGAHIGYTTLVLTAECTLVATFLGGDLSSRNGAYWTVYCVLEAHTHTHGVALKTSGRRGGVPSGRIRVGGAADPWLCGVVWQVMGQRPQLDLCLLAQPKAPTQTRETYTQK